MSCIRVDDWDNRAKYGARSPADGPRITRLEVVGARLYNTKNIIDIHNHNDINKGLGLCRLYIGDTLNGLQEIYNPEKEFSLYTDLPLAQAEIVQDNSYVFQESSKRRDREEDSISGHGADLNEEDAHHKRLKGDFTSGHIMSVSSPNQEEEEMEAPPSSPNQEEEELEAPPSPSSDDEEMEAPHSPSYDDEDMQSPQVEYTELQLTGPSQGMIVINNFCVVVHKSSGDVDNEKDYMVRAKKAYDRVGWVEGSGDKIFSWTSYFSNLFDLPFTLYSDCDFGFVELDCMVFRDSKVVTLEVKWVIGDGIGGGDGEAKVMEGIGEGDGEENHATADICIHGNLSVFSSQFPTKKSVLLNTPANKAVRVTDNNTIPLSRSVVVFPYDSDFTVEAILSDHNGATANGTTFFDFQAIDKNSCTAERDISGPGGKIKVIATVDLSSWSWRLEDAVDL